jgi:hypothetical protein
MQRGLLTALRILARRGCAVHRTRTEPSFETPTSATYAMVSPKVWLPTETTAARTAVGRTRRRSALQARTAMRRVPSASEPVGGPPERKRATFEDFLGSGLIDHSQNMTAAAMQIAEK